MGAEVVTYSSSLVQLCCWEGGTLQTNITGVCGQCLQCLGHAGFNAPSEFALDVWPALISTIQQKWHYGTSKLGSQNTLQLPLLPSWDLRSWQEETRLASLKWWPCRGKPSQNNSTRGSRRLNHTTRRQQPRGCLRWDQQKNHSAETSPNCWPSELWKNNMAVFLSLKFWSG